MPLVVDESGRLDIGSVASLTRDELQEWVDARLHGRDGLVPGDARQGEYPHRLFASIYLKLDRVSLRYLRDIVEGFLRDMARNPESSWRGEPAHALLFLVQELREREFIRPIYEMAKSGQFFDEKIQEPREDLHCRLLQTLVALRWIWPKQFWHEQYERAPERYAGVCFAGLAKLSIPYAVDLLPRLHWDNANVQVQMRAALRGLLPVNTHTDLAQSLKARWSELPAPAPELIRAFLPEVDEIIKDPDTDADPLMPLRRSLSWAVGQRS